MGPQDLAAPPGVEGKFGGGQTGESLPDVLRLQVWILSRFNDESDLNAAYFQVDLQSEYRNSWDVLKNESPEYEDEIQIEDIDQLAEAYALLVCLDFSPSNLREIVEAMPNIKGISLTIGSRPTRDDLHHAEYPLVVKVLEALRG